MRYIILILLLTGCAKKGLLPTPNSSGSWGVPIQVEKSGLVVCKKYSDEVNCLEVQSGEKFLIPINEWNKEYDQHFAYFLNEDVMKLLHNQEFVCDKGVVCEKPEDWVSLKNLKEFVYENSTD